MRNLKPKHHRNFRQRLRKDFVAKPVFEIFAATLAEDDTPVMICILGTAKKQCKAYLRMNVFVRVIAMRTKKAASMQGFIKSLPPSEVVNGFTWYNPYELTRPRFSYASRLTNH